MHMHGRLVKWKTPNKRSWAFARLIASKRALSPFSSFLHLMKIGPFLAEIKPKTLKNQNTHFQAKNWYVLLDWVPRLAPLKDIE